MKRYLLFAGADFYPIGGWDDFEAAFDTLDEAAARGKETLIEGGGYRWFHVVDIETMVEVAQGEGRK